MPDAYEYDVFLSFASADQELVRPIWQELSRSGLRVFWSDASLKERLGESWFDNIQSSLEKSRHFLLIASQSSMSSDWVKREYQAFFQHCYREGSRRLIPIVVGDFQVSQLPLFLKQVQAARFNNLQQLSVSKDIMSPKTSAKRRRPPIMIQPNAIVAVIIGWAVGWALAWYLAMRWFGPAKEYGYFEANQAQWTSTGELTLAYVRALRGPDLLLGVFLSTAILGMFSAGTIFWCLVRLATSRSSDAPSL